MRQDYVDFLVKKIKESKEYFPDFEKIIRTADYDTIAWHKIKMFVKNVCDQKRWIYVNKDELTSRTIQKIREEIRKEEQDEERRRRSNETLSLFSEAELAEKRPTGPPENSIKLK